VFRQPRRSRGPCRSRYRRTTRTKPSAPPVIDVSPLVAPGATEPAVAIAEVAARIDAACRDVGFFSIVGHGVAPATRNRLTTLARDFFARPEAEKAAIAMAKGGRAWRGWFPLGGELTSGAADRKEGIYFGRELPNDDPRVVAATPLHGSNLFPARPAGFGDAVLEYMDALERVAAAIMRGVSAALGVDDGWLQRTVTDEPTVLFRIFTYPLLTDDEDALVWSVGEHTDYGLLTVLGQDGPGLQVRTDDGWVDVAADSDALVCNIGDMLERMTGGRYRSTAHRVRNTSGRDRLSFPFFYDPGWDARVEPIARLGASRAASAPRWDGADPLDFDGTYGEYLLAKVSKVFPELFEEIR
jgi:isopenicillin N synthase-like dioxygenase